MNDPLPRLRRLLAEVLESNPFYGPRLRAAGVRCPGDVASMADYRRLPFTTKEDLSLDQAGHPPYGTNLTYPLERYVRVHQTSGTTGRRLRWLDTRAGWDWFTGCWMEVYRGAGVMASDRLFFAFSFAPFIGFWSAFDAAARMGAMAIPGGGMSSAQRLEALAANDATVLVCTPTYALHLARVARDEGLDPAATAVRATIHAGEPGASLAATRARIEQAWGARCFDHAGATEVGAWGFECGEQDGLHLNEDEFVCEILEPGTDRPADEGELVITNLGRIGSPVIRYRTGDRVRWHESRIPAPAGGTGGASTAASSAASTTPCSCAASTSIPAPSRTWCAASPRWRSSPSTCAAPGTWTSWRSRSRWGRKAGRRRRWWRP